MSSSECRILIVKSIPTCLQKLFLRFPDHWPLNVFDCRKDTSFGVLVLFPSVGRTTRRSNNGQTPSRSPLRVLGFTPSPEDVQVDIVPQSILSSTHRTSPGRRCPRYRLEVTNEGSVEGRRGLWVSYGHRKPVVEVGVLTLSVKWLTCGSS